MNHYVKKAQQLAASALRYKAEGKPFCAERDWNLAKDYIKLHYGLPV